MAPKNGHTSCGTREPAWQCAMCGHYCWQQGHGISKGKVNKYNVIVVCGVQLHGTLFLIQFF